MSIFLLITIVALLAVFSVDVRQKRRAYLKQERGQERSLQAGMNRQPPSAF